MADDIDLSTGDPSRSSPDSERRTRRRSRASGETSAREQQRTEEAFEAEARSRLDRLWDRVVKAREARDDEELAEAVREDAEAMTQGFISITSSVPFLRMPLIMFLNIAEPVLAFNRVGRIIFWRVISWRQRRIEAAMQAQAEAEEAYPGASVA